METLYCIKEFFNTTIKSRNLDSRSDFFYINNENRQNYIFNVGLNGIEDSDLIVLIGTNPRYEATILNLKIRKSYLKNKTDIYSLGDLGDLTYPYKIVDTNTETIKNIVENKNDLSNKIINAKKPLIIIGQSALKIKSSKYIFEELKKFLRKNNKINNEWNSLNIVSNNASTVGSFDLDIINSNNSENTTLERIKKNDFEILFLFGQDNLKFNKKNEFIIYIGSHGDKGAEMADVILPGAAYTEQDGYYTNLEGKIQKAYQASYPPGEAKEDWIIINELSNLLKRKKLYKNKNELIDEMFNYLNKNNKTRKTNLTESIFINEKILLDEIDYYYSNVISRSSKTMTECRNEKIKIMNTGTEG